MKRNWTSWAALTVVVVGGILWALAPNAGMLPYNIPDPSNEAVGPFKECQLPRKQLGASSKSGVTAPTASAEEGPDSVSCQQAINSAQREKQDLAAQWTAATANRNAVAIAERQMRWSVLEFFALIGTLTFAYIAISDGRKHSVAELRAYVSIKDRVLSRLYIGQHARVDFKIFNAGTTPAHNMRYRAPLRFSMCRSRAISNRSLERPPEKYLHSQLYILKNLMKQKLSSINPLQRWSGLEFVVGLGACIWFAMLSMTTHSVTAG